MVLKKTMVCPWHGCNGVHPWAEIWKLVRSAPLLLGSTASTGLPLGWFITRRWGGFQGVESSLRSTITDSDSQQNISVVPWLHNILSMHYAQNINKAQMEDRIVWFCFLLPCVSFSFITSQIMWLISWCVCMAQFHFLYFLSFPILPISLWKSQTIVIFPLQLCLWTVNVPCSSV